MAQHRRLLHLLEVVGQLVEVAVLAVVEVEGEEDGEVDLGAIKTMLSCMVRSADHSMESMIKLPANLSPRYQMTRRARDYISTSSPQRAGAQFKQPFSRMKLRVRASISLL
jgi:hypothetical protein